MGGIDQKYMLNSLNMSACTESWLDISLSILRLGAGAPYLGSGFRTAHGLG